MDLSCFARSLGSEKHGGLAKSNSHGSLSFATHSGSEQTQTDS
jgi:hypothetical protein